MKSITINDLNDNIALDQKALSEISGGYWDPYLAMASRLYRRNEISLGTTHSPHNVANMWYRGAQQIRALGFGGQLRSPISNPTYLRTLMYW